VSRKGKKKGQQSDKGLDWKEELAKLAKKEGINPDKRSDPTSIMKSVDEMEIGHIKNIPEDRKAKAPYNFIPLNKHVVEAERIPDFDVYNKDRYTGWIDLSIVTKTPLYIRDTLTMDEMEEKQKTKKDGKKFINSDFFSPGGKNAIPGSSLRGMIRTMIEIISYGKFGSFEQDRKYHFRSFADRSLDLKEEYAEKILSGDFSQGYSQSVKAGYLIKDGTDYKIRPAEVLDGCQFFRVEEDLVIKKSILSERMHRRLSDGKYIENRNYHMGYVPVRFIYEKPRKHTNHSKPLYYAKVKDIVGADKVMKSAISGVLVHSGWMPGPSKRPGKHLHWVIGPPTDELLEFMFGVIDDYKNDFNLNKEADLLRFFSRDSKASVPCFYLEENGQVKSFGHTGIFRLAYEHKLNDLLPKGIKDLLVDDIAGGVFGNESTFAGRVCFHDAFLIDQDRKDEAFVDENIPYILSRPKPTTFQHYLVQNNEIFRDGRNFRGIKNYNDNTLLRGNKLYWHRTGENWKEKRISFYKDDLRKILRENNLNEKDFGESLNIKRNKVEVNMSKIPRNFKRAILKSIGISETQHTKIKAVNSEKTFLGKIRFENLSKVELGALLFALDLPEGCCHKLGMGKPLGLGSIKVTPKLFTSKREGRYENLFSEWKDNTPKSNPSDLKTTFEKYILGNIGESKQKKLWNTDRLQELKVMLDYTTGTELELKGKTMYMDIKEFTKRKILPTPSDI